MKVDFSHSASSCTKFFSNRTHQDGYLYAHSECTYTKLSFKARVFTACVIQCLYQNNSKLKLQTVQVYERVSYGLLGRGPYA